jgi:hypothetical protein
MTSMTSIVLAMAAAVATVNAFSCLDAKGNAVDYWVALKHNSGLSYSVFDADAQAFSVRKKKNQIFFFKKN